jgi:hypothetical protein
LFDGFLSFELGVAAGFGTFRLGVVALLPAFICWFWVCGTQPAGAIPGLFEPVFGELFCWFADCGLVDAFDCAVAFLDAVLAPPLLVDVPWETVWA